jgi:hypothetical protein
MKVFGDRFSTGDLSAQDAYQLFKISQDMLLLAARLEIVVFNSPSFSNLNASIFSVKNNLPDTLICTSDNSFSLTELTSQAYALKEIFFSFRGPNGQMLSSNEFYAIVLNATSYVGDENSHLAWKKGFPDPTYLLNDPISLEHLQICQRQVAFIGTNL